MTSNADNPELGVLIALLYEVLVAVTAAEVVTNSSHSLGAAVHGRWQVGCCLLGKSCLVWVG